MYRGGHILFWKLSSLDLRFEYLPIIQDMANPYSEEDNENLFCHWKYQNVRPSILTE